MRYPIRLILFATISAGGHFLFAQSLAYLPNQPRAEHRVIMQVQLHKSPTPPAPPFDPIKKPELKKQTLPQKQVVHQAPGRRMPKAPTIISQQKNNPKQAIPTERPATTGDTTLTPEFGISMESTSQGGNGPSLPVGNTVQIKPNKVHTAVKMVKPLAAPVQAYEVTKMPLPQGRCSGEYTEEARQAGVEGTVILDLIVSEEGIARDIKIIQGLSHGLNEAAIAALKKCRFTPGEREGKSVPVRIRGFKIRFFLQGGA